MKPIAIFFHGLFFLGDPPRHLPQAGCIIANQIVQMIDSGLWEAASEIHFGINGGVESEGIAKAIIPAKAKIGFHGLKCHSENRTVEMVLEFAKTHPGWLIFYAHSKSASHPPGSDYATRVANPWREGMMQDLVVNWRTCVTDLEAGHDIVCMHWIWDQGWDKSQHIPAGNFLWITSDFAAKLPSLYLRERIKQDGIGAASSRFEAEVAWGNGPRPNVKAYRTRLPF
jgi:hypothetical protein